MKTTTSISADMPLSPVSVKPQSMRPFYKIFRSPTKTDPHDRYRTLFHAVEGSRALPYGCPIQAPVELVRDGGGKSRWYIAGFHLLETHQEAERYLKRFATAKDKSIVRVLADTTTLRKKPRAHSRVFLSQMIVIPKDRL